VADLLASPETFSSYMQRDLDRATATLCLQGASALVRNYCRWSISQATETFVVDGSGTELLSLPTLKLNTVTLTVDGTLLDADTYQVASRGQIRRLDGIWPCGLDNVSADTDHGYTIIPDDITLVVCSLASRYYSNPDSLRSKASGDDSRVFGAIVIASDFSELALQLLAPYRLN